MNKYEHRHNRHANGLCEKIRVENGADRVACFIAHNGGHAQSGFTFSKYSLFFQSISQSHKDKPQIVTKNTNVPSAMFASVGASCFSEELRGVAIGDVISFEDPLISSILIDEGVKSCVYFPAVKKDDETQSILALIRVDWFEEKGLKELPSPKILFEMYYDDLFKHILEYTPKKH